MNIGTIEGFTTTLGEPKDWNEERDGKCMGLPVRMEVINDSLPSLTSAWFPTPEELKNLNLGAPVLLRVIGQQHPPVMLDVGEAPTAG